MILDFADALDEQAATVLRRFSQAPMPSSADEVNASAGELKSVQDLLKRLVLALLDAKPLIADQSDEVPDAYTNEEHARMVEAVHAVIAEARHSSAAFRSWIE